MTIFGPDISSYQAGLDLSRLSEASFVIAKASEGTYYTDADYQGWRRQAAQLKLPFVWYHFLSSEDVHAQAAHTAACVGDKTLPGMLDVEPEGSSKPNLSLVLAYADAAKAAGLNLRLIYLPHWYWQEIGSPGLSGLTSRGLALVSSSYPGGAGTARALYPGDGASGWASYGGVAPALYQYTNQASDGGQRLDYNAFRGTQAQLSHLLHPTSGEIVPLTNSDAETVWAYSNGDKPDVHQTLANAATAATASNTKLDQVLTQLATLVARPAVPAVDVKALAAALAPLVSAGATADEIASAVVAHLATTLAKG